MNILGAWSNLLTWANLLGMLRPFPTTGPFVHMFIRIIWDIRSFLMIYVAIVWAFAFAFYMSVPTIHPADAMTNNPTLFSFTTPDQSFYATYLMSVGEFADYLTLLQEYSFNSASTLFMFGLFILLVIIVLLNLLIAIMGEAYNNVICNGVEDDWRYYQCGVICEQERCELGSIISGADRIDREELKEKYPVYLHIIEPNIPSFKAKFDDAQSRLHDEITEYIGLQNESLRESGEKHTEKLVKGLEQTVAGLEHRLSHTIRLLEQKLPRSNSRPLRHIH